MDFCPEIAVLQSSCQLLGTQLEQPDGKHKKEKLIFQLSEVIKEITQGLENDNTDTNKVWWNNRLHDIILFRSITTDYLQINNEEDQKRSDLTKLEIICRLLYPVNVETYLSIVHECHWFELLMKSLVLIYDHHSSRLWLDSVQYLNSTPASQKLFAFSCELIDFMIGQFLVTKSDIIDNDGNQNNELSEKIACFVTQPDVNCLHISLCQGIKSILSATSNFLSNAEVKRRDQLQQLCFRLIFLEYLRSENIEKLRKFVRCNIIGEKASEHKWGRLCSIDEGLGILEWDAVSNSEIDLNIGLVTSFQREYPCFLSQNSLEWLLAQEDFNFHGQFFTVSSYVFQMNNGILSKYLLHMDIVNLLSQMFSSGCKNEDSAIFVSGGNYRRLMENCKKIHGSSERLISTSICANIDALLWRLEYQQPGYQECLDVLIQTDSSCIWSNHRLISLLSKNVSILCDENIMMKLYTLVANLTDSMDNASLNILIEIVQKAFALLTPEHQDSHVCHVATKFKKWPTSRHKIIVTPVLNKLTKDLAEEIMSEVCQCVLCDAEAVMMSCLEMACKTTEQVNIVMKVFARFPSLLSGKVPGKSLCNYMKSFLYGRFLDPKQQQNMINLVCRCLKEDIHVDDVHVRLLEFSSLFNDIILPNCHVPLGMQPSIMCLTFTLELFKSSLEVMVDNESALSVLKEAGTPWLLCMAELWHSCVILWNNPFSNLVNLIQCRECLIDIWRLLQNHTQKEGAFILFKSSLWFNTKVSGLDFTVKLRLDELFDSFDRFQASETNEQGQNDKLQEIINNDKDSRVLLFLRVVSLSDKWLAKVQQMFQSSEIDYVEYEDFLLAATQILPHCVQPEWKRCAKLLDFLVSKHIVSVPYQSAGQRSLPVFDLISIMTPLSVSFLLADMMVLTQFTDVAQNLEALSHVCKCFITTIHEIVLAWKNDGAIALESKMFLSTEVFAQVCRCISWMPENCLDAINIFLLDTVCFLSEMHPQIKASNRGQHTFNHCEKALRSSAQLINSEQTRSMILKKL